MDDFTDGIYSQVDFTMILTFDRLITPKERIRILKATDRIIWDDEDVEDVTVSPFASHLEVVIAYLSDKPLAADSTTIYRRAISWINSVLREPQKVREAYLFNSTYDPPMIYRLKDDPESNPSTNSKIKITPIRNQFQRHLVLHKIFAMNLHEYMEDYLSSLSFEEPPAPSILDLFSTIEDSAKEHIGLIVKDVQSQLQKPSIRQKFFYPNISFPSELLILLVSSRCLTKVAG